MAFWLLKTEPSVFSWQDQCARGALGEPWTGVRNYQARNNLRLMQLGDHAFFYHTDLERQIVGVVRVTKTAYPDPSDEQWSAVSVVAEASLVQPIGLQALKQAALTNLKLQNLALIKNTRLSVQPVTADEWDAILHLAHGLAPLDGSSATRGLS